MSAAGGLLLHEWALAGHAAGLTLPAGREVQLPAPGPHPRRARLPELALTLAQAALSPRSPRPDCAVLLGTALGSLTETETFLEGVVGPDSDVRPRAFTSSVHNAAAGHVARAFGARGENQTFVQGELSPALAAFAALALRARGEQGPVLLGAVDECTPRAAEVRRACKGEGPWAAGEGGAVLYAGAPDEADPPLARLTRVALGRPRDPAAWLQRELAREPWAGLLLALAPPAAPGTGGSAAGHEQAPELELPVDAVSLAPRAGAHPALGAAGLALAAALLGGEMLPATLGLPLAARPPHLGVVLSSRTGEWALVRLEAAG